jgi:hypothetical protein
MFDKLEKMRDNLNELVGKDDLLHKGEILKLSQQLDEQIVEYYLNQK